MPKFHVNSKGESGECTAQIQCPFGGDERHYASPEIARQAYELSMASSQIPESMSSSKNDSETKKEQLVEKMRNRRGASAISEFKANFVSSDWGGYEYKEIVFDRDERAVRLRANVERFADPTISNDSKKLKVEKLIRQDELDWINQSRTEIARSGEKNVPMRLIPTGSKVIIRTSKGPVAKSVGKPDLVENKAVGKHRDVANEWDYVSGDTSYDLAQVPVGKREDGRWNSENHKAQILSEYRAKANEILAKDRLANGESMTKDMYDPSEWGFIKYEDAFFNEQDHRNRIIDINSEVQVEEINEALDARRNKWNMKSNLESATEGNESPIRMIPVGSIVKLNIPNNNNKFYARIEAPTLRNGKYAGKVTLLMDKRGVAFSDVNTSCEVESLEKDKKLSPRWREANSEASAIAAQREKAKAYEKRAAGLKEILT